MNKIYESYLEIRHDLLTEKVYGKLATIYHRTDLEHVDKIYKHGFKPGSGDMYGTGIYGTYDLKSQLKEKMNNIYGSIVIKAKVNVSKILFLDYKVSKIRDKHNYTLVDQLKKLSPKFKIGDQLIKLSEELEKNPKYTSDYAVRLINQYDVNRYIEGISFTGRRDGKVLVIYNPDLVTPMSYNSTSEQYNKLDNKDWTSIKNKNNIKKSLETTLSMFNGNKMDKKIIELKDGLTLDIIKEKYPWIFKAEFNDAILGQDKNGLVWKSGTWKSGTWESGTWKNGTWKDGTWYNGTWYNGYWHGGLWLDGTWKGGNWIGGTWHNGTWKDGAWYNGIWENGNWNDGTWYKGTWKGGFWKRGNWKSGTWESGTWENGTWWNGIWKGGTWYKGTGKPENA